MDFTQIRYEVADNVLTITLNRPERLNAWTAVMQGELLEAFDLADADDARARGGRHRRRPRLLRRRRPRERRRHVRLEQARGRRRGARRGRRGGPARRRRPPVAAHLPLHEAGDRGDQRAGRGRRRDDDAADGRAAGRRERAHGLRVHPPRDRARGGLELVPAAGGRDLAGDGVGRDGTRVRRPGGAARPARAQRAPRRRAACPRRMRSPPRSRTTPRRCRWRSRAS